MGTNYKGKSKEVDALNSFIKLSRASDTIRSKINLYLVEQGLTENQFGVLDILYHVGPLTQKEIGKKLLRSGGNITLVIDNLEKLGLVRRVRGKEDRREFIIQLEEKGKKIYKKIFPGFLKLIMETFSILTDEEHRQFQKSCKKIGLNKINN